MTRLAQPRPFRHRLTATTLLCRLGRSLPAAVLAVGLALSAPPAANANPSGATVKAGSVTLTEDGNRLDIHQGTDKAIVDWRRFSIDSGEITQFHQPSSSSITLNRVTGPDPSSILGTLSANGQIVLVNPNGVFFGPGSRVDVAGLVATTSGIRDEDFLAGIYDFTQGSPNPGASVVNEGEITIAEAGYAALVAPWVRNSGTISARLGRVTLGGAEAFTLDLYGDNLVTFRTGVQATPLDQDGQAVESLVRNSGRILADGGRVTLAADNVGAVVQSVINMDGIIQANSIAKAGGEVVIAAAGPGIVDVSGSISAQGDDAGETGGTVKVLGERVGLFGGARIDASGDAGGGEVLIGGNFQGNGPERNARQTLIVADASISADAGSEGDGGRIIVWADETTQYYGSISATGGASGGNGGFAEVSGKQNLAFYGAVYLSAPLGELGTLLLDPDNIIVANAGGAAATDVDEFADLIGTTQTVDPATLDGVGGNVTLQAIDNITFTDAPDLTIAGATLTATAGAAINVNNTIDTTNAAISLTSGTGDITFA
ncbi:MAG: filamentous hemagglutinin N-terminal domain-containing protein, partial [Kiloniellales bacterium]